MYTYISSMYIKTSLDKCFNKSNVKVFYKDTLHGLHGVNNCGTQYKYNQTRKRKERERKRMWLPSLWSKISLKTQICNSNNHLKIYISTSNTNSANIRLTSNTFKERLLNINNYFNLCWINKSFNLQKFETSVGLSK